MENMLDNHVAVVTGAASGNGRAIARAFAREGADVVVADIREEPRESGQPTHEMISEETGRRSEFVECDVTSVEDLESVMDAADDLGGVDTMVNNAGIFWGKDFFEVSESEFDQIMDINVKGVFFGAQVAAERMVDSGGGSIINMSSEAAYLGTGEFAAYCTSKGAVKIMTYAIADALGPEGIRVNAIHPGVIKTAMTREDYELVGHEMGEMYKKGTPLGKFGVPEDVENAALFLASDLASHVSGESILVDGGKTHTT